MYNILYRQSSHWNKKKCALNDKNKGENKLIHGPYSLAGHDVSSGET